MIYLMDWNYYHFKYLFMFFALFGFVLFMFNKYHFSSL